MDEEDVCEGCGRTEEDIELWDEIEPEGRKKILLRLLTLGLDGIDDSLSDYEI